MRAHSVNYKGSTMKIMKLLGVLTTTITYMILTTGFASAATYSQNWDAFPDGTTAFGDGTNLQSNDGAAQVRNNTLRLTDVSAQGTISTFGIPPLLNSSLGWTSTFDVTLISGNPSADGFSFNYGPALLSNGSGGEEGFGVGLSVEFDTFDNGFLENGYNVAVNGVDVPGGSFSANILPSNSTVNANISITYDPINGVTLTVDTGTGPTAIFTNLATPGFSALDTYDFAFGSRTGTFTETIALDNLVIQTQDVSGASPIPSLSTWGILILVSLLFLWSFNSGRRYKFQA